MKRSSTVSLGVTLALAAAVLAGCGDDEPEHNRICVDEQQTRLEDEDCDDGQTSSGGRATWFYHSNKHAGPAVGGKINPTHGTYTKPYGSIGTLPKAGGFGGSKAGAGTSG